MFVTAVCDLLLLKLKRQKNKCVYETYLRPRISNIGVRVGGGGGGCKGAAAPRPQILANSDFLEQREKIWAKPVFKDVSMFFFITLKR